MIETQKQKSKKIRAIIFIVFILAMVALTIYLFPKAWELRDEVAQERLREYIDGIGFWGWLLMLGIQILQVVIAFIPGEPVEIIMGLLFGPWLGALTCMLGIAIGTAIIFFLAKKIGMPFVSMFVDPDQLTKYRFLNTSAKRDVVVFTLFFIPGTPKDVLTYFVPFIKMSLTRFIIISLFARIPSIISSTILGHGIGGENWVLVVIMAIVILITAIIGLLVNRWYMKKHANNNVFLK